MLLLSACQTINLVEPEQDKPTATNTAAASANRASAAAKPTSPFKKWADVTKDTRAIPGFFNLHLKRDQSLLLEVQPDQLDKDFGFISHYSKGTGVFNIHDGLSLTGTRLMRFRRVGDQIYLVHVNTRFTADEGTPLRTSLDDNVGHSIIGSFKIESEHESTKALLINFSNFIVSDYMKLSDRIKPYFRNRPVGFDKSRSYVEHAMSFPKNTEIDALLTYKPNGSPITTSAGVSDVSSVPVGVRYSFFELPDVPMAPRMSDDRVGFFMDAHRDFSKDKQIDQMVRYVNRWRLEKKDPTAEVSDPVQPIVYYIDRTVPHEYRRWVKEGIEGWQKAFEAAGFSNAIIAKEAPEDDSTWSAEDMRYSTVRWSAAHQMGYAIGPSQKDPRSGEILNADILLSSVFMSGWGDEWQELVGPNGMLTRMEEMEQKIALMGPHEHSHLCMAAFGKQFEMGLMKATLMADGLLTPVGSVPEDYYGPALRDLVLHEVGHTLGMRHNYRGSGAIPHERLNDEAFTREHGISLSVMDYAGTNINPNRAEQGHYVNMEVGSYDVWAISYAYTPDDTKATEIARQAADPMHAYNTDLDAFIGGRAIDPLSSAWDLSDDPMAYATDQRQLAKQIYPVIEDRLIADNGRYSRTRGALNGLLFAMYRQLTTVAKVVGGSHYARDHKGDPNGRMPLTPVPGAEQREAVNFILSNALNTDDLPFDAETLNKAAPSRFDDWNESFAGRYDVAVYEAVQSFQMNALGSLTDRHRLSRMINADTRQNDAYTVSELFESISSAVYGDLTGLDRFQRNLQLAYANHLSGIMNNLRPSSFVPNAPPEAQALARLELTDLGTRIDAAMSYASNDRLSRAHLLELKARVDAAFDIDSVKEVN